MSEVPAVPAITIKRIIGIVVFVGALVLGLMGRIEPFTAGGLGLLGIAVML